MISNVSNDLAVLIHVLNIGGCVLIDQVQGHSNRVKNGRVNSNDKCQSQCPHQFCPVEELEGFWTIPNTTVHETANWLRENPTADLITTSFTPVPDDPTYDSAIIGYIPAPDSQEGIVYTIAKKADGVAVRAEIAAQTESAFCPPLPDGGMYGAPGQG